MDTKAQNLFNEFNEVSKEEWKEKIIKDLKGGDYDKLIWKTNEGFDVQPFYTQEDLKELEYLVKNQNSSFNDEIGFLGARQWNNRQLIEVENEKTANEKALLALNNGCDAIAFHFGNGSEESINLNLLLKDIFLEDCIISYQIKTGGATLINKLKEYYSTKEFDFNKAKGGIEQNIVDISQTIELIYETKKATGFKILSIHHDDNLSSVTEKVGNLILNGVRTISKLIEQKISLEEIFNNIELNYKLSNNYFFEIAALRSLRMLFTELAHQYGLKNYNASEVRIHADTYFELTEDIKDNPYLNMLGNTTQAMSAILGGCNSLTVIPYNKGIEVSDAFSERISRNVSNILKEESYFDKVNDPSAGSFYIETLTDQIAEKAWEYFRGKI